VKIPTQAKITGHLQKDSCISFVKILLLESGEEAATTIP
jgi:hypothetical protein